MLIAGDINLRMEDRCALTALCAVRAVSQFKDILDEHDLYQHVNIPTHVSGHTLDIVISRHSDSHIRNIQVVDSVISDHRSAVFNLTCCMQDQRSGVREKVCSRDLSDVDIQALSFEL